MIAFIIIPKKTELLDGKNHLSVLGTLYATFDEAKANLIAKYVIAEIEFTDDKELRWAVMSNAQSQSQYRSTSYTIKVKGFYERTI